MPCTPQEGFPVICWACSHSAECANYQACTVLQCWVAAFRAGNGVDYSLALIHWHSVLWVNQGLAKGHQRAKHQLDVQWCEDSSDSFPEVADVRQSQSDFRSPLCLALVCWGKSACRQSWTGSHSPSVLQLPPSLPAPIPHLRMTRLVECFPCHSQMKVAVSYQNFWTSVNILASVQQVIHGNST